MHGVKKVITAILLSAIVVLAGSSLCLATGNPSVMSDCGNQMNETVSHAVCPFMSTSISTLPAPIVGKEITFLVFLFTIPMALILVTKNTAGEILATTRHRTNPHTPPRSFLDTTTRLIASGTLHSRVFDF